MISSTYFHILFTLRMCTAVVFNANYINQLEYSFEVTEDNVSKAIRWIPGNNSWLGIHLKVCGRYCKGNTIQTHHARRGLPLCGGVCFPCDCKFSCSLYGTCCPVLKSGAGGFDDELPDWPRNMTAGLALPTEKDVIDVNNFTKFVTENPDLDIDIRMQGHFHCHPIHFNDKDILSSVFAITKCPQSETNQTLRDLCETDIDELTTMASVTPYTDKQNGIVFKNIYCLQCWNTNTRWLHDYNQATSLVDAESGFGETGMSNRYIKWNVSISCDMYHGLYQFVSNDALLVAVLRTFNNTRHAKGVIDPHCFVRYIEPQDHQHTTNHESKSDLSPRHCTISTTESVKNGEPARYADNKDNETQYETSSKQLRHLCESVTHPAYRFHQRNNVFCYTGKHELPMCTELKESDDYIIALASPINIFILGQVLSDHGRTSTIPDLAYLCPNHLEWMDQKGQCQLPSCVKGKILLQKSGMCQAAIPVVRGLGYRLSTVLVPDNILSSQYAGLVQDEVISFFNLLMDEGYIGVNMVIWGQRDHGENDYIRYIKIQGHVLARKLWTRDEFERKVLQHKFQVSPVDNFTITLQVHAFGADLISRMRISEYTAGNPEDSYHLPISRRLMVTEQSANQSSGDLSSVLQLDSTKTKFSRRKFVYFVEVGNLVHYHKTWKFKDTFIDINPSLLCPFVSFKIRHMFHTNDINLQLSFNYRDEERVVNTTFLRKKLSIDGEALKICIDDFKENFQEEDLPTPVGNDSDTGISWMNEVKRHLSLSFLIISIICLLATSITICACAPMRTLPGLNTVSLSLTLAVAQLDLILVVEVIGYVHGYVCILLGIALHYAWLCSFLWMGLASFHMYKVFKSPFTRPRDTDVQEKHSRYCFYTFGTSAVIVCTYICVCEIVSDAATTGYSDRICFLDVYWSYLTVVISFALPLVLLILFNWILFALTVREMVHIKRLQISFKIKSRAEMAIYVKLSTLTGVQWLFIMMAVQLNNYFTDLLSSLFIGFQGIFIFFSFTCTSRTRRLFRNKKCRKPPVSDSPSSQASIVVTNTTSV